MLQNLGGPDAHVASIEDSDEDDLIKLMMEANGNVPGDDYNYWIGLVKNGASKWKIQYYGNESISFSI